MPAHIFELLYAYYYLKNRDGRPPSAYKVAAFLKIDFCTVLQRRKRAVACKVIVEPETYPVIGDWAVFTDRGAEAFVAIMEGNEVAPCEDGTLLSLNREIFPPNVRYERVSKSQYYRYVKALAADESPRPES